MPFIHGSRGAAIFPLAAPLGPLDLAGGNGASIGAYGLRALSRSYAQNGGPIADVRRSTDSATLTLHAQRNGKFSTAQLLSWAGSASVYVSRKYDQTGSGNHLVQPTATLQPTLVNAGTLVTHGPYNSPALVQTQANAYLQTANYTTGIYSSLSSYSVGSFTGGDGNGDGFTSLPGTDGRDVDYGGAIDALFQSGNLSLYKNPSIYASLSGSANQIGFIASSYPASGSTSIQFNSSIATGSSGAPWTFQCYIAVLANAQRLNTVLGMISEHIVFAPAISSAAMAAIRSNVQGIYGTP